MLENKYNLAMVSSATEKNNKKQNKERLE